MGKYKALIADVDGTLIPNRKDALVSPRVIQAIQRAQKYIHIEVATSRPFFRLKPISDSLHLKGPSILFSGSQIIDLGTKKTLWEQPLDREDAIFLAQTAIDLHISFLFNDNGQEVAYVPGYKPIRPYNIWAHGLLQETFDEYMKLVSHLSHVAVHPIPSWQQGKIDFTGTHLLATKQHAILELAKILGIETHEIIGVGDGNNDLPLLMACGLKVAMGNAGEDLKAIADYVAPTVEEDGLADVIEKFVLQ